ncbi:putative DNA binding domain-containing protein [Burkholderia cenocepacia]|uniref:AAA family ATPase n=1 Tax=Burkholderia cenocepacia TaxID=95486 RepID=UPI001B9E0991|nr:AAA family ATPase [Burkholderia cenocepacia]MBR8431675.1 putative DNA binding domain-containing protein [Burkholderia cenocepacia]
MFFKSLLLHHFGSYDRFEVAFDAGINVITGDNATGKTQLIGALFAALIGKPAIRVSSDGIGPSSVRVQIDEDGVIETLTLNVSLDHRGAPQINRTSSIDGHVSLVSPSTRLLSMLSNPHGPRLLLGRDAEQRALTSSNLNSIGRLLPEKLRQSHYWSRVCERGTVYDAKGSGGERTVSNLLAEFSVRRSVNQHLPLIVDELFQRLPSDLLDFSMALLEELAQTEQVIVLTNNRQLHGEQRITKHLNRKLPGAVSLAYYNYSLESQKPRLRSREGIEWVKGRKFSKQESRSCELKEIKGNNPLGSIKSVVDQYVVAFLNAGTPQEGAIFWGIRDGDLAIIGVPLSDEECDVLRRVVTEKLHQITPPLPPTKYRIDLHQVTDGIRPIPDLYVVEVRVPSIRKTLLFATGSQEVFVKTDAGKKKLSVLEIQYELLDRHGIDSES